MMKILDWNTINNEFHTGCRNPLFEGGSGISIGSFDGLHLGHRLLIQTLVKHCKEEKLVPVVLSFKRPLPSIKHNADYQGDISTLTQRISLLEELGVEVVIVVDFNDDFASMTGTAFFKLLINLCNMKLLAEGSDFRCGYKGSCEAQAIAYFCRENNISLYFVEPVLHKDGDEEERISSSYIRKMIKLGFFATVGELLQRPFALDLSDFSSALTIACKQIKQVLPGVGVYHCKNEMNDDIRLKITENELVLSQKSKSLKFT